MSPEHLLRQALQTVIAACKDKDWSKDDIARLAETALKDIPETK